ncbi:hypothetical protein BGZ68_010242 [Mortierella alpina]|nr:hypothetical protein BGZ68_010242 [Mortierella alpina]
MALLATVSNNDFSKNIEGLGLARNTDIIARIPSATSAAMLDLYCSVAATKVSAEVVSSQFENASHVFLDKIATPLEDPPARHDSDFTEGTAKLEGLMQMRVAMKAQRARSLMISPPFYVARQSTPNQFRPVFKNKKSILAGRKCKDVTTCKQHEHQLPPRVPGPRPRPPATKKPIVKKARNAKRKTAKVSDNKRNLRPAVRHDHVLRNQFKTKTLTVGSVAGCMVQMGFDRGTKAEPLRKQLQTVVYLLNDIQLRAYWAAAIYMTHLLDDHSLDPPQRKALLDQIIDDQGFMNSLARLLYHGEASGKGYASQSSSTRPAAASAQEAYERFSDMTNLPPLKETVPDIPITKMTEMAMVPVQSSLRSHYRNCTFDGSPNPDPEGLSDIDHFFNMNKEGQYCDFPTAKFRTGFVVLPECVLLDIFYAREDTKGIVQELLQRLGQEDLVLCKRTGQPETFRFKAAAHEYCRDHIGRLIEALFGTGFYGSVSIQQDPAATKYKLKGSIVTNGLEVHLLAYDTMSPKPRKAAESKSDDDDAALGITSELDSEMDIEGGFVAVESLGDEEKALLEGQVQAGTSSIISQEHQQAAEAQAESSTSSSVSNTTAYAINWRQRSKLLENVEVVFQEPEYRDQFRDAVILGADPGEINPLVVSKIDSENPNARHTVKVTRSMLYTPYARYRSALEERKAEAGVDKAESYIPTFSRATLTQYFEYLMRPIDSTPDQETTNLDEIHGFYRTKWIMKKAWECKKAQRSCIDLAIKGILRLAGGSEGRRREVWERRVIICIGLASFNSQTGLPSKHSILVRRLVERAKSLGYVVVGAHEYFTSAKCPRPNCTEFLRAVKGRTRYCPSCKMFLDRDAIGAENIGRVCQAQVVDGRRPAKYKPEVQGQGRGKGKRPSQDMAQEAGSSKVPRHL